MTSIDYAVWFRQPCRADDWLLYDLRPAGNGGARGLTVGTVHDTSGRHVASLAMELLLRDLPVGG
jgi:acyl-CoA thioesterase II